MASPQVGPVAPAANVAAEGPLAHWAWPSHSGASAGFPILTFEGTDAVLADYQDYH
jgi:hypothetical protein